MKNAFCEICGTLADDRTNDLVAVQCDACAEVDCDWEDDGSHPSTMSGRTSG